MLFIAIKYLNNDNNNNNVLFTESVKYITFYTKKEYYIDYEVTTFL